MNSQDNILPNISKEEFERMFQYFQMIFSKGFKEGITLRVFVEEYSKFIKDNRSKKYHDSVKQALKHFTNYFGLQRTIQSITFKDIEEFVGFLIKKVPKGYRVYVRTLKAAFSKCIDWNYIDQNHFTKIKLPKKQKLKPAFINKEQLQSILAKIENPSIKDVVITGFYSGMRLNEIMNLTWLDVNLEQKEIRVGSEEFITKGRNQRFIPMCNELYELFLKLQNEKKINRINKDYIFCKDNGELYTGSYASKAFKKACRAAGIEEGVHFHSLRHSTGSFLAQNGVSTFIISKLLGHSSASTAEIYSHLTTDTLKNAIKNFD